jgi:NAD(P)-dependent dehydrogenase (short-subunit alcohol dehydrogenase family)
MRHIFLSGATTGMGQATVELLLSKGVAVSYIDTNAELSDSFRAYEKDGRLVFTHGSVANRADVEKAVKAAVAKSGPLSGAFFSAGIHHTGSVETATEADFDKLIDVNVKGTFHCLQACLPHFAAAGGSIVLMGSDQVFIGKRSSFLYGMTKGAIGQITKSLALDLAPRQIRVNSVCPGTIRTPMAEGAMARWAAADFDGDVDAAWEKDASFSPMGRIGQPAEVAALAGFLLSDESSFITGANMSVDGGYTAQ